MHRLFAFFHLEFLVDPAWWERNGSAGLFIFSAVESFFLLPPPEAVLIPLAIRFPQKAILYGAAVSIGSVFGALIGYGIGYFGGRPFVIWLTRWRVTSRVFKMKHFEMAERMMRKYGPWAVGIAGFTIVPYKIFTIGGGLVRLPLGMFVTVSLLSRSARFMLEAVLILIFREAIVDFLKSPMFHLATITLFVGFALGVYFYRKFTLKARARNTV